MASDTEGPTRHDLEAKIVKRCWGDSAFRKEFTADPAGAAVKYLVVPAASLPKIVVHEEPADSWYIVLPPRPPNANELPDQDLESLAGGVATPAAVTLSVTAMTFTASLSITAKATIDAGW
jgi:hypothetical protein